MATVVLDAAAMRRTLGRMAHEVLEANRGAQDLVVVGILRRGYPVAKRLAFMMTQVEGTTVPCGKIDVRGNRDDDEKVESGDESEIPFSVEDKRVILVDEVIYTGRTVRAALDALVDFGRPQCVQLAVLVDRGHRELPIRPDYSGCVVETARDDYIDVRLHEIDGEDEVVLQKAPEREAVR
ncbi:MAG TPA: bifunctional pyr operon transcriptional regulator/uracil phosphoribosyltransferase PyrR [Fimbriimonadaceae bacterium]|nr:bifunctional pyr operon transcriptional regulator/uracil phosphoribosyltransferase PyrR [Fimbriimonadaceae bacterium]